MEIKKSDIIGDRYLWINNEWWFESIEVQVGKP